MHRPANGPATSPRGSRSTCRIALTTTTPTSKAVVKAPNTNVGNAAHPPRLLRVHLQYYINHTDEREQSHGPWHPAMPQHG